MRRNFYLSNITNEGQWDDFFNHSNVVISTEEQRKFSDSFQTGVILSEKLIRNFMILITLFLIESEENVPCCERPIFIDSVRQSRFC